MSSRSDSFVDSKYLTVQESEIIKSFIKCFIVKGLDALSMS